MTVESAPASDRRFLRGGLPWLVAAAGLLLYLATLNPGLSLNNLPLVARVNGWEWRPAHSQPLLFLLTWPCRWLPATAVPLALNLLTAACASLTLALLARSVALLPHDRLEQQRRLVQHPRALLSGANAGVPILLATVALGLQLSFWENATSASGEMLDLLLFAYLIRCLLEYRLDGRQAWLDRAALVCGLAMANGWLMVACLPLFVVALLWTRRLNCSQRQFFSRIEQSGWPSARPALISDLRFLLRMACLGLAGLSLILLLPLAQSLAPDSSAGFWPALRATAGAYQVVLQLLGRVFLRHQREAALVLVAVSLLPVLLMSIRWRPFATGKTPGGLDLVTLIFYLAHAFLLALCLWVAFDPLISPRHLGRRIGFSLPFLPLYYLSALSVGYYSGFFLVLFGEHGDSCRFPRRLLGGIVPALVYALLGVSLAGLLFKNLPVLRATNRTYFDQHARCVAQCLPPEDALVLAEDPLRLAALQTALLRGTNANRYLLAEIPALAQPTYRARLDRRQPGRWPELASGARQVPAALAESPTNAPLDIAAHLQLLTRLVQRHRVFCLQPAYGVLAERFQFQPQGLIYELKLYPTNSVNGPPLTPESLDANAAFWQRATETELRPLLRLLPGSDQPGPGLRGRLLELARLELSPPASARAVAGWYSAALNDWGVRLQQHGRAIQATPCFGLAQQLNPDNLPARVNLLSNSNLLAGAKMTVLRSPSLQEQLGSYHHWQQLLAANGPFDEPNYCYHLAVAYADARLFRQASQQLERAVTFAPDDLYARISLGDLLNRCRLPDQALQVAAAIEADARERSLPPKAQVELAFVRAQAWFTRTNAPRAEAIVHALLASRSPEPSLLSRAADFFAANRSYSNALRLADQRLQLSPDDFFALTHKGTLSILARDFSNAIPLLTRALALTNSYSARLNRAFAWFQTGRFVEAEADYQALLQAFPADHQAWKGLAEIALRRGDTNTAVRHYQRCLSRTAPGSLEARAVAERLKTLQPAAR